MYSFGVNSCGNQSKMSKLNSDLRKIAELMKFASTYYPERTVALILNADWITFWLWKFCKPLLDKRTAERVTILRDSGLDLLDKLIGLDKVGPKIGGSRSEEWPALSTATREQFQWGFDATGSPEVISALQSPDAKEAEETADLTKEPVTPVVVAQA